MYFYVNLVLVLYSTLSELVFLFESNCYFCVIVISLISVVFLIGLQ